MSAWATVQTDYVGWLEAAVPADCWWEPKRSRSEIRVDSSSVAGSVELCHLGPRVQSTPVLILSDKNKRGSSVVDGSSGSWKHLNFGHPHPLRHKRGPVVRNGSKKVCHLESRSRSI